MKVVQGHTTTKTTIFKDENDQSGEVTEVNNDNYLEIKVPCLGFHRRYEGQEAVNMVNISRRIILFSCATAGLMIIYGCYKLF